ncbi:MAG: efflux RND transporter permease subunit, partial [Tannerella sp.]|nr:efflux RND transporter permease subunit [Tannerella sp.]
MFNIFIKRPILSTVISLLIVFLGLLSIGSLPVTQFPDIMPPSVHITATYVGANSDVLAKTVAVQIERAINGVPGMTYMTTVCNNDGFMFGSVYFKVGTDPDVAAVAVQNRVATVYDELPEEVTAAGVIVEKEINSMLMYLNITSEDTTHHERFIYNFADLNLLRDLKRIEGVAYAEIMGSREFAMRVWLNPDRMAAFNLSPQDITEALRHQSVEAAPGKTGISSSKMEQQMQYVLQYSGRFTTPEEYGEIVIKALPDGSMLTLHDIADIELDAQEYNMTSFTDGRPSASIMIKQRPGSNARQVINDIKAFMENAREERFAPGMDYNFTYDVSRFLDASISVVIKTLLEAFLLVTLVVFLFLQDWRSTLIPALAVPVSLIGTFFFMQILGFSINMLTLFALVLAIGIVVDNAIVVVEAVHVKMRRGLSPYDATFAAMKEIGGAIVAITLVMSAVFIPVGFLEGTVGIFYRQFSLTLAVAIVISGVNALTLSPALCAILLKSHATQTAKSNPFNRFFSWFNVNYERFSSNYLRGLTKYLDKRIATWATLFIFCLLTWGTALLLPSGFIPEEDQGMVYVNIETPPGATLERTDEVLLKIQ